MTLSSRGMKSFIREKNTTLKEKGYFMMLVNLHKLYNLLRLLDLMLVLIGISSAYFWKYLLTTLSTFMIELWLYINRRRCIYIYHHCSTNVPIGMYGSLAIFFIRIWVSFHLSSIFLASLFALLLYLYHLLLCRHCTQNWI